MDSSLPLPALLSQAFVAFTIEFDNEFEHQTPHRTANDKSTPGAAKGPWLVSMAMWIKYMRHVPLQGITVAELQTHSALSTKGFNIWFTRLSKWWRYLVIDPPVSGSSSKRIPSQAFIRPTKGGSKAIEVWRTLTPLIEERWRKRFGRQTIDALQNSLNELAAQLDPTLPPFFLVLDHEDQKSRAARLRLPPRELSLPELLAKVLLAFTSDFDAHSPVSLALCSNLLRVTSDQGQPMNDLPRLTGLSANGVAATIRQLQRLHLCVVRAGPSGSRAKMLMLTPAARSARDSYVASAQLIESAWRQRFGRQTLYQIRTSLESLAIGADGSACPLLSGLHPYPNGWRASLPSLETLPYFPLLTHRGGFPDGS